MTNAQASVALPLAQAAPSARAGWDIGALAIAVLIAMWLVPNRLDVFYHPAVLGVFGTILFFVLMIISRERNFSSHWEARSLAVFLAVMPSVYLMAWLVSDASLTWFFVELLGQALFATWALFGRTTKRWRVLALGIVAHALLWDSWHLHETLKYMPDWYAWACLVLDLGYGAFIWLRAPAWLNRSVQGSKTPA